MKEQTVINFLFSHNEDKNKLFIEQIITDENKNCIENIKEAQKSIFKEYAFLSKISPLLKPKAAVNAAKRRLEIIKDEKTAKKALLNNINAKRLRELINDLPVLACEYNEYLYWEKFLKINKAECWNEEIKKEFLSDIKKWNEINYDDHIKNSFLYGIEYNNLIDTIRKFKLNNLSVKESNNIEFRINQNGSIIQKIWTKHYLSILYTYYGKYEDAKNKALEILLMQKHTSDFNCKKTAIMLGLISLGITEYHLGNKVEGIICVLSGFKLCFELNEILPFLEAGYNIILKYIQDNRINKTNKDDVKPFLYKVSQYTGNGLVNAAQLFDDFENIYNELGYKIYNPEYKNADWALLMQTYIQCCYKLNKKNEAVNLILENYIEVMNLMQLSNDFYSRILKLWCQILENDILEKNDNKNSMLIIKLMEYASDNNEKRRNISNGIERGYLDDSIKEVNLYYLQWLILFYNSENISSTGKNFYLSKIETVLSRLAPRVLIEEKKRKLSNISEYKKISFYDIQSSLKEDEAVYQYIICKWGIISIFLTKNNLYLDIKSAKNEELIKKLENFDNYILNDKANNIYKLSEDLSVILYYELIKYLENHSLNKLYNIQYNSEYFFNPNLLHNNGLMIKKIDSIVNLVDYNIINTDLKNSTCNKILISIWGNEQDKTTNIKYIKQEMEKLENVNITVFFDNNDDINKFHKLYNDINPDLLMIFAHGVQSEDTTTYYDGAHLFAGNKRNITADEILSMLNTIKNLIVFSCGSGSSQKNQTESSCGLWSSIIKYPVQNVILGRWNIPVKQSVEIAKYIINNLINKKLSDLLSDIQKQLINKNEKIETWAGFEYWKNL